MLETNFLSGGVTSVNGATGNVEIGGINLLVDTGNPERLLSRIRYGINSSGVLRFSTEKDDSKRFGALIHIMYDSGFSGRTGIYINYNDVLSYENLSDCDVLTLSFYAKASRETRINFIGFQLYGYTKIDMSTQWKRISIPFRRPSSNNKYPYVAMYIDDPKTDDEIWIKGLKLEKGTVATDWTPAPEDVVTKTPPDIFDALDSIPEMHRNIYRGKNLGTVFTDEQKANIKNGTFHDLWVGDYWVINNHTWRIVDINYWYNKGDQNCTTPHIVVMPDAILYSHKMNNDNVTTGGYYGSLMYTEGLTEAKNIVNTDFGEGFVLNHRVLLTNKVDSGHASAGTWYDSTVELANEIMMYGCSVFSAMNNGTAVPYSYTTECTQLALFRLVPRFINASRQWFWLRDVVSATPFASVGGGGFPAYAGASDVGGVRPVVGITGGTASADKPDSDLEMTELSTQGGDPL